jgi:hypothetical protein
MVKDISKNVLSTKDVEICSIVEQMRTAKNWCQQPRTIESLSPSGMPLFSFFPLKGINKVQ